MHCSTLQAELHPTWWPKKIDLIWGSLEVVAPSDAGDIYVGIMKGL